MRYPCTVHGFKQCSHACPPTNPRVRWISSKIGLWSLICQHTTPESAPNEKPPTLPKKESSQGVIKASPSFSLSLSLSLSFSIKMFLQECVSRAWPASPLGTHRERKRERERERERDLPPPFPLFGMRNPHGGGGRHHRNSLQNRYTCIHIFKTRFRPRPPASTPASEARTRVPRS